MAAVQRNKVRPIMNLSSPKERSFNDAINEWQVEGLQMSTPRLFADSVLKAGKNSVMSKQDIQDAYKLIPNPVSDWRLYGFLWLGKYFFDTSTVFGSKVATASFDPLPETLVNIVCSLWKIPKFWIHRQLDDVPIVSPKGSKITEAFTKGYKKICQILGVPLASDCPLHEKAFGPSTFGTVLGIGFDTSCLEWNVLRNKATDLQNIIDEFLNKKTCTLLEAQKLHGKLSSFAQMSDFLMGFRYNLVKLLRKFEEGKGDRKLVSAALKDNLWIWKKVINSDRVGLPLCKNFEQPTLFPLTFISDAAGAALEWEGNICRNVTVPGDRGVAAVGFDATGVTSVGIIRWPEKLMVSKKGQGGKFFSSKSGTLEMVGLLIPFITQPSVLAGQHIVLSVDNTSVVYATEQKIQPQRSRNFFIDTDSTCDRSLLKL
jgi:hypothetical protein